MGRFTPEFADKEITTSRREFAEISARCCNDIVDKFEGELSRHDLERLRILLTVLSANIMAELFDDELEVEK